MLLKTHLNELKEVANHFLKELKKGGACFSYKDMNVIDGYRLYMFIEESICSAYKSIKAKYGDLLQDLAFHWPKVDEALKGIEKTCSEIERHNERTNELEEEIFGELRELIKNTASPKLDAEYFMRYLILGKIIPKLIEEEKKTFKEITLENIKKIYQQWKKQVGEEKIKVEGKRLQVAGIRIGEITPEDWKRIEPKLINIIHRVLKEHTKELDELMNQGNNLINKVETIREKLEEGLEEITKTQILSIKKICKYIQP